MFFLALLGPIIPPDASQLEQLGVPCMAMVIDGSWYVLVAILLAKSGAADWLSRKGKSVDTLLSVLLIGVGGWLIAT